MPALLCIHVQGTSRLPTRRGKVHEEWGGRGAANGPKHSLQRTARNRVEGEGCVCERESEVEQEGEVKAKTHEAKFGGRQVGHSFLALILSTSEFSLSQLLSCTLMDCVVLCQVNGVDTHSTVEEREPDHKPKGKRVLSLMKAQNSAFTGAHSSQTSLLLYGCVNETKARFQQKEQRIKMH